MTILRFIDPRRVLNKVRRHLAISQYDAEGARAEMKRRFKEAGLEREQALERLNAALATMNSKPFNMETGEDSVHWLLFSALSLSKDAPDIKNILEIGTFRGKTAALLKLLFPHAEIFTCDLPEDDPIYRTSYRREDPTVYADHKAKRDANIDQDGITLLETNSFFLPEKVDRKFDLIWVDGGHLYPEVAWDTCNAWHMCRSGGYVLFDDVFTHPKGGDGVYGNTDANAVIQYLAERSSAKPLYFLKRENPIWSAEEKRRKYVVMLRKP